MLKQVRYIYGDDRILVLSLPGMSVTLSILGKSVTGFRMHATL
jgi:hypothetical protein